MAVSAKKAVKKLSRIGVVSAGITLAALYAVMGVIYALIYAAILAVFGAALGASGGSSIGLAAMGIGFVIILVAMPIVFAVIGFIGGALMALVYNFVAKYTGGITFEVSG